MLDDLFEMDLMEEAILQDAYLEIFVENYEFQQWLEDNKFYINEEATPLNTTTNALKKDNTSIQGFAQWKVNTINNIKQNLIKTAQYAFGQEMKENKFLIAHKHIALDMKSYPPKKSTMMKNAPNYEAAMQRITLPITGTLNNIDFSKIDTSKENKSDLKNLAIKKTLLPSYNGQGDFKQFAKNYFYGADGKRMTIDHIQCAQILPNAYQYCISFETRLRKMDSEIKPIMAFVNRDSNTGQPMDPMMKQPLQQMKNATTMNQMASTNPASNVGISKPINAAYNFIDDMNNYFGEEGWNPPTWISLDEANNSNKNPMGTPLSSMTPKGDSKAASKKPKNNAQRQHQIVCGLLKDLLDGKLTAMCMLYRDFLYLCKVHINSYINQMNNPNG